MWLDRFCYQGSMEASVLWWKTWHSFKCYYSLLLPLKLLELFVRFISSVQFSLSVVSNSLQPQELQHIRPPFPSPTPRVHSNSCPLSQWCHPTISSSVIPFSRLQYLPASGSFQMSQLFISGGQRIGVSASASVLPGIFRTNFL